MDSHVEHKHDLFIKRVSHVDSNPFNLNPWLIYEWVSRVGFIGRVTFFHP